MFGGSLTCSRQCLPSTSNLGTLLDFLPPSPISFSLGRLLMNQFSRTNADEFSSFLDPPFTTYHYPHSTIWYTPLSKSTSLNNSQHNNTHNRMDHLLSFIPMAPVYITVGIAFTSLSHSKTYNGRTLLYSLLAQLRLHGAPLVSLLPSTPAPTPPSLFLHPSLLTIST